jgi:hypothetical protein
MSRRRNAATSPTQAGLKHELDQGVALHAMITRHKSNDAQQSIDFGPKPARFLLTV